MLNYFHVLIQTKNAATVKHSGHCLLQANSAAQWPDAAGAAAACWGMAEVWSVDCRMARLHALHAHSAFNAAHNTLWLSLDSTKYICKSAQSIMYTLNTDIYPHILFSIFIYKKLNTSLHYKCDTRALYILYQQE